MAAVLKDPSTVDQLQVPSVPDHIPIYDHWEKAAKRIILTLWKTENAWIFHYPVDAKAWSIEDYYDIVKNPMDFTTIKEKLNNSAYQNLAEFKKDAHLVFDNCILYNGENDYGSSANKMRTEFEKQCELLQMDFYE